MNKILLFIGIIAASIQYCTATPTVAQNWTKTDCDGKSHTLFSYLDSDQVVILQFDMMNCSFCTNAAIVTDKIDGDYQLSHPGKVKMFSLGFTNSTTCSQMQSWKTSNGFKFSIIEKCPNELAHYGAMGMPTIVVVGNKSHKVYYYKQGFVASDETAIRAAIEMALTEATGISEVKNTVGSIVSYPNPATNKINLAFSLNENTNVNIELFNMIGEKVYSANLGTQNYGVHTAEINIENFNRGFYFAKVNGQSIKIEILK